MKRASEDGTLDFDPRRIRNNGGTHTGASRPISEASILARWSPFKIMTSYLPMSNKGKTHHRRDLDSERERD